MNSKNQPNLWRSFQSCLVASMPYIVSPLIGIAVYYGMLRVPFSEIVAMTTAICVAMVVLWMLLLLVVNKRGSK
jgi:cation transporter-like permease